MLGVKARLLRAISILALFLLAGGPVSSQALERAPIRTGLWVCERLPRNDRELQKLSEDMSRSRGLSGVSLSFFWKDIEPRKGEIDFGAIDRAAAIMHKFKLPYQFCLVPGVNTPGWVFEEGAEGFTTTVQNPHRANFGKGVTLPLPWDPVYQRNFSKLIAGLGAHSSDDPLCVSVVLSCANYMSAEMHLPRLHGDIGRWQSYGNYAGRLLEVYKKYIDEWSTAFPRQEVSLHVSKVIDLPASFDEEIINYGMKKYPARFTIQTCELNGRRDNIGNFAYDIVLKYRGQIHLGFQSLAALRPENSRMGSLELSVLNMVHAGGEYWELWTRDGTDPETTALVAKEWEKARSLGYEGYRKELIAEGKYH